MFTLNFDTAEPHEMTKWWDREGELPEPFFTFTQVINFVDFFINPVQDDCKIILATLVAKI
jgi:hypothetical protein